MRLNHPLARIVIRDEGPDNQPTIGLLAPLRGQGFFEKGMVYEVRETFDTITIVKIGPSCIAPVRIADSPIRRSWAEDIGTIICMGSMIFATMDEAIAHQKAMAEKYKDD